MQDEESVNRFYHSKDIKTFEAHPMQFMVWRYSGKSRIIVEFVSTVLLSILIHILINFLLKTSPSINEKMNDFFEIENQYKTLNATANNYRFVE